MQLRVSFERYTDKITPANIRALTEALQTVIQEFNTRVQTTAGRSMIEQSITEMTRQIQQGVAANQAAPGSILSSSAGSMQSYHQQLTSLLSKTIETANRDLGSHLRRAAEDAGKHVVALDRALEEELTRSIESPAESAPDDRTNGHLPIDIAVLHDARGRRVAASRSIML